MTHKIAAALHVFLLQTQERTVEAARSKDRGQTSLEYLGIAVFVVAVIIALLNTKLGDSIGSALDEFVNKLKGSAG